MAEERAVEPDKGLENLLIFVRDTRGFDLTGYKRSSLARRIRKRMGLVDVTTFADYQDLLEASAEEYDHLFDSVLINVTSFFRDTDAWTYLQRELVPEMLAQLKTRTDQIRSFIDKGTFAAIYVPAFQAKDLALALDEHKQELTPERRKVAEPAIAKLVRTAYLLDAFGDIGNKQQISEAYTKFVEAANDIHSAFPQ